uniref:Uncharacterized protein n=1 Tax=Rhizophora mucronata TaxID=61149 RepID=A0A2P2IJ95_RHIMU
MELKPLTSSEKAKALHIPGTLALMWFLFQ